MADVGRKPGGTPALDRRDLVSGCGVPTNIERGEGRISGPLTTTKGRRADRRTIEEVAEMVVNPGLDCVARGRGEGQCRHWITVAAQRGLCPLRRPELPTDCSATDSAVSGRPFDRVADLQDVGVIAERPVDEQAEREPVAIDAEWHGRRRVTGDVPQNEIADPFERVGGEALGNGSGAGSVGRADHDVEWCERV